MTTLPANFNEEQAQWYDEACARIDQNRLKQLIFDLTAKHSPTGAERDASEFMVDYMNKAGIEAHYQPITEISGNCVGRVRGSGSGPSLLLYAPVDTLLEGDPAKEGAAIGFRREGEPLPGKSCTGEPVDRIWGISLRKPGA